MMTPARHAFIFLLCLFLAGCVAQGMSSKYKAPLGEQGEVIVYLQPMPQEAEKLRFIIDRMAAVRSDGSETPFDLYMDDLKGVDLKGVQRRLASVILPPGSYTGVSIHIRQAFVRTEEGDVALFVPDEPIGVDHAFSVVRQKISTLFLALTVSGTKIDGVRFAPVFSLASTGRVLINFLGLATNSESNTITVFDKTTMQVVDAIATGQGPKGIVLDRVRSRAYVAASREDIIEVVDVFEKAIINRLRLNLRDRPIELALTPDGRTLLSVNNGSNTVSIIDARSMIEITRIAVGEGPASAVIDPSGFKAFIMNSRSSTISIVDLTQRKLALTIGVEGAPIRAAFDREGSKLFVINTHSPNLTVVDLSRLIVTGTVFIGMEAASIKVDDQTGLIYVGKKIGGEITVIDPFSLVFIDTVRVDGHAAFLAIDEQERNLFVVLPDRGVLQKINLVSKKKSARLDLGSGAYAVVVLGGER